MNKKAIIEKTKKFAKEKLSKDSSGHDWFHTERVWKMAKKIAEAEKEKTDIFVVEMAALLHDIWDWKFNKEKTTNNNLNSYLIRNGIDENSKRHILHIIQNMSFKGSRFKNRLDSLEGKIVYDADKLDAIGAIGISRAMITGTSIGQILYNPYIPLSKRTTDFTKKGSYSIIHHFYDKLFLLKDLLHTKSAKKIAIKRHKIMEQFLKDFFAEWEGKQ